MPSEKSRLKDDKSISDFENREQMIHVIIDSIPIPVYYKESGGRFLTCNRAFTVFTGMEKSEILGNTANDLMDPDQARLIQDEESAMLKGSGKIHVERRIMHPDGTYRHVLIHKTKVNLGDDQPGFLGVVHDITESRQNEKYLQTQYAIDYVSSMSRGIRPALEQIMKLVFEFDWVDAGGIYLFNEDKSMLTLRCHRGLSKEQVKGLESYGPETDQVKMVRKMKPYYGDYSNLIEKARIPEFLREYRGIAIIPLVDRDNDEVIGNLNLASRHSGTVGEKERLSFENIAARIVILIKYAQAQEYLQKSKSNLEEQVRSRTRELRSLNRRLKMEIAMQKKTTRALNRSEKLYKEIFDHSQDGIVLFDAGNFEIVEMNNRAYDVLGLSREEFMDLDPGEFTIFAGGISQAAIMKELARKKEKTYVVTRKRKDQTTLYHNIKVTQLTLNRKKYILGILHDLTPLVEKEKEIVDSESRHLDLQDNLPIGIFTTLPEGNLIYANRQLKKMLAIGPEKDLKTIKAQDFYTNLADREKIISGLAETGVVNNIELMVSPLWGEPFWAKTSIRATKDKDGNRIHLDGTLEDITEQKKHIDAVINANRKVDTMMKTLRSEVESALMQHDRQQSLLVQKSKLESLGELAAGIAHEVNQPLGIMALSFENLQAKILANNATPDYLETKFSSIENNIRRIRDIIDHIRVFSREQELPTLDKVNVNKVVKRALSLIGTQYHNHNIHIQLDLKEDLGFTVGSNMKLEQAILNLLSNAKYAVEDRAALLGEEGYTKTITIITRSEEKKIHLTIRDNGVGIPPEAIGRVFDPFFTTKPEGFGTGLGLSIVYGIIKDMRGDIKVDSKKDSYTNFEIIFSRFPENV